MNKKRLVFCLIIVALCSAGCPEYGSFHVYYYGDSETTGDPPRDGAGYLYRETATILPKPEGFKKGDKKFLGWKEEWDSWLYQAGDTISMNRDIHLYAQWEGEEAKYFTYRIESGEVVITGYNADYRESDLVIPSSIENLPVAHIGNNAFYNHYIYGLVLPGTLKTIGTKAFAGAAGLSDVTIPDSVTSIGDLAFQGNQINALKLGDGLQTIGAYAFDGNSITSLRLPPAMDIIGNGAFNENDITFIKIGEGVTIESGNALGKHGESFRALYDDKKSAGVYAYEEGQWGLYQTSE
ncbi:MAG: leucine-rich repeat domain-containing protein [Treponema sp.]|jgi:hypothetical protein|nr:leucine-rich repeat domain-containing protein [Treponema sp.]